MLSISGCSIFTSPTKMPVIEDRITAGWFKKNNQFGTTALTASRRMLIYKLDNSKYTKVCGEPPPDVGEEVRSALEASITLVKEKLDTKKNLDIAAAIKQEVTTKLKGITRPAGIQFERDLLASLCQFNMNGAISNDQVKAVYLRILEESANILKEEIKSPEKIIAASLEKDPSSSPILNISPVKRHYKINNTIELKATGNMLNAYSNVVFAVRMHPSVSSVDDEWVDIKMNSSIKKEIGKTDSWRIYANLDDNKYNKYIKTFIKEKKSGVWQFSIYVQKTPNGNKEHILSKEEIVIYQDDDALKAEITAPTITKDNPIDLISKNDDLLLEVTIKPPKYHQYAYPDEIEGASLKAEVTLTDGSIIAFDVQDKLVKHEDGEHYKTTLIAKKDINKPLKDALKKKNLSIEFKLIGASGKLFPMKSISGKLKKMSLDNLTTVSVSDLT